MIKKFRRIPLKILIMEALLRRIPPNHPSKFHIEEELRFRKAGYRGELSLDYHLSQLPQNEHFIFHDLRLPLWNNTFFQIDALLLSRHYFTNYEAKNHTGTLTFEEQQMLQTYKGRTESYPNPITQAENQQYHLENLIRKKLDIILPGTSFVVVTNPSSIIKFDPQYEKIASKKVIRAAAIRQNSELFWTKQQKQLISYADLQKISQLLLKLHTPSKPDILQEFRVDKSDIHPGVYCDKCKLLSFKRAFGTWKCNKCGFADKMTHVQALIDHLLLNGNTITNSQFRYFLQFDSVTVATHLLGSLNLPFEGTFKDRKYHLSLEALKKWI
ncbi:NERD domain-containing protein [Siminovitchia terrae]|uniref:NERD domain-containing protein n=2 Tax=Siminovitchia terrae TaxID=1914933 RepID=A0A429X4A8_SIMTE|nr:NERD domain-containing protein [Siminovitchia terrae]